MRTGCVVPGAGLSCEVPLRLRRPPETSERDFVLVAGFEKTAELGLEPAVGPVLAWERVAGSQAPSSTQLAEASSELQRAAFVGLVEQMDVSLCRFARAYLQTHSTELCARGAGGRRENVGRRPVADARETALLERFNKFDAALYELAVAEFARRGSPGVVVEPPPADFENVWEVRTDGRMRGELVMEYTWFLRGRGRPTPARPHVQAEGGRGGACQFSIVPSAAARNHAPPPAVTRQNTGAGSRGVFGRRLPRQKTSASAAQA